MHLNIMKKSFILDIAAFWILGFRKFNPIYK